MIKNTKVKDKGTELESILKTHFEGKLNLARIKLISLFIVALCKPGNTQILKMKPVFEALSMPKNSTSPSLS